MTDPDRGSRKRVAPEAITDDTPWRLLVAVRHTRVEKPRGICLGRTPLTLARSYLEEQREIAKELRTTGDLPGRPLAGGVIYTSPLERCRTLAGDLGVALGYPVREDSRLLEFDYGLWEGRPWEEIPREETEPWMENWQTRSPPGGESLPEMINRVQTFCEDLPGEGSALAITHEGVLRCLEHLFAHTDLDDFFRDSLPCGVIRRYRLPLPSHRLRPPPLTPGTGQTGP